MKLKILTSFLLVSFLMVGIGNTSSTQEEVEIDLDILKSKKADEDYYRQIPYYANTVALIKSRYIEEVSVKKLIQDSLRGMLAGLDSHSEFLDEEQYKKLLTETKGEYGGIGMVVGLRDGDLVVIAPMDGTPADKAGIKPGDIIVKINGQNTHEITLTESLASLRGEPGEKVDLTIKREDLNELLQFTIKRKFIELISVRPLELLEDNIAYIRIVDFDTQVLRLLKEELNKIDRKKVKGLILDLRNNPGGLLVSGIAVSDLFLDKESLIVYTKDRSGKEHLIFKAKEESFIPDLSVVVLINHGSASAAEILAGALQDHNRGLILGDQSFGKGSVQMVVPFENGTAIRFTTDMYYTPDGVEIEGKGITPDIEVPYEPIQKEDLKEGLTLKDQLQNDPQVLAAMNVLKGILITDDF